MTAITRALGLALITVGVVSYVVTGSDSLTALIPAVLGLIILALGMAAARDSLHRHAIHAALGVALVGALGTVMNLVHLPALLVGGDVERPAAVVAALITFLLCGGYVVMGIRSFRAARRERDRSSMN